RARGCRPARPPPRGTPRRRCPPCTPSCRARSGTPRLPPTPPPSAQCAFARTGASSAGSRRVLRSRTGRACGAHVTNGYVVCCGDADPRQFVDVLVAHAVLVDPKEDEIEGMWAYVPIHGKWNVWQRKDDRLSLWTAWGEQPVQQLFLDADETKIWDAFDGNKR